MSMELHVLLRKDMIPSIARWNEVLLESALPLIVPADFNLLTDSGFRPFQLRRENSGVEVYFESDLSSELETYPILVNVRSSFDSVVAFRWGSRLDECAVAILASASLAVTAQGIVYDPQEDVSLTPDEALTMARETLSAL